MVSLGDTGSNFTKQMAHLWLDELVRDAQRENVPRALNDDLATVLRCLGINKAEDITAEHYRKWVRGFIGYLAEGNAPSSALVPTFE